MLQTVIKALLEHENLTEEQAAAAMLTIMDGEATPAQIASFLTALRMKGETSEEVCGFARVMRDKSLKVPVKRTQIVDTCGTGGDRLNTFNISTTAAFIVAGAGVAVAKHGNRAASSKSGSADVLEALGINIMLDPATVGSLIDEVGIGFLFAQSLHPAMKHAGPVRREIGIRTVFNILGPLTNPAGAKRQVLGVFEEWGCELLAGALGRLGSERALVVHGRDGLDEIATFGETLVSEVQNGVINTWVLTPDSVSLKTIKPSDIEGGEPSRNAEIFLEVLSGGNAAAREIACLNAGAAIYAAGAADSVLDGLAQADSSISSGAAKEVFERYRSRTQEAKTATE